MRTRSTDFRDFAVVAILSCCFSGTIFAQFEEKSQIAVFVEFIELEKADAFRLVAEHEAESDAEELRDAVEKRLDVKKATLVESIYTRGRFGETILVKSAEEFLYGTEGDPPEIANELDILRAENLGQFRGTPSSFAAFETRDIGPTLEFEAIERKGFIEIEFSVSLVTHLFDHFYGRTPTMRPENEHQHKSMPHFATQEVSNEYRLESGKPVLAGSLHPIRDNQKAKDEAKASKRVLVFLTAWSLK